MAKKVKVGKLIGEIIISAIIASFILWIVAWIIGAITPITGIFGGLLSAVISVLFFTWALKIHPGKEEFLTAIPVVILALAIIEFIRAYIPQIPALTIPFTWSGLALGIGSVFLADTFVKKYILK